MSLKYTYQPLDSAGEEIRLLRLRPAESLDAPLRIRIFHASLSRGAGGGTSAAPPPPSYEALSYVWGGPMGNHPVWIEESEEERDRAAADGEEDDLSARLPAILVTANLNAALRHLRYRGSPASGKERVLWVDALCINQADPAERSRQVEQMRTIYERCAADIAWLGPNPYPAIAPVPDAADLKDGDDEARAAEALEKAKLRARRITRMRAARLRAGLRLMRRVAGRDTAALTAMVQRWNERMPPPSLLDHTDGSIYADVDTKNRVNGEEHDPDNPGQKRFLSSQQVNSLYAAFSKAELWTRVWIVQELSCAPRVVLAVGRRGERERAEEKVDREEAHKEQSDESDEDFDFEDDDNEQEKKEMKDWEENEEREEKKKRKRQGPGDGDHVLTLDWDRDVVGGFLSDKAFVDAFHSYWGHGHVGPAAASIFSRVRAIQLQRAMTRGQTEQNGKVSKKADAKGGHEEQEEEVGAEEKSFDVGRKTDADAGRHDPSLINVLARFKWTQSTDPRDKVYGLLGLVREAPQLPPVDYTKTVAEVYADTALAIANTSGCLDVISQNPFQGENDRPDGVIEDGTADKQNDSKNGNCNGDGDGKGQSRDRPRVHGLPSWAPNLDRSVYADYYDEFATILFAQRGIYAAGRPDCRQLLPLKVEEEEFAVPGVEESSASNKIRIRGLRLRGAVLGRMAPFKQGPWEESGRAYINGRKVIDSFRWWQALYVPVDAADGKEGEDSKKKTYAPTGEPLQQAFWRTFTGDCAAYPIRRLDSEQKAACGRLFVEACAQREKEELEDAEAARREAEEEKTLTTEDEKREWRRRQAVRMHRTRPSDELVTALPCSRMAHRMLRRWGFAQTTAGLFMMVRSVARPGDAVVVLDGSKVPVLLRPQDLAIPGRDTATDPPAYYKYVCPAYVHGFMDGESVAQVEAGTLAEQDFVLV